MLPSVAGGYSVILADQPWSFKSWSDKGKNRAPDAMVRQLIVAPRREHSRKPDEQYDRIEALLPGPYLELFARCPRPGWDVWGNQTDRFEPTYAPKELAFA